VAVTEPGIYTIDPNCAESRDDESGLVGFQPLSIKVAEGYQVRWLGWYGNDGDQHCGIDGQVAFMPSGECSDMTSGDDKPCLGSWVYDNVRGFIEVAMQTPVVSEATGTVDKSTTEASIVVSAEEGSGESWVSESTAEVVEPTTWSEEESSDGAETVTGKSAGTVVTALIVSVLTCFSI
jgi:hypothetical protein